MTDPRKASRLAVACVLSCALAAAVEAQPTYHLGLRLGAFEPTNAGDTYDALYGGDTMFQIGAQFEVRFRRNLFLGLAVDHGSADGELIAALPSGQVISTGTATDLTLTPLHLTCGWIAKPETTWSFYFGGGPPGAK
ncbi:MAG: hypothetical protein V3T72_06700, partial [Thermoanaerobaculia bacterium]